MVVPGIGDSLNVPLLISSIAADVGFRYLIMTKPEPPAPPIPCGIFAPPPPPPPVPDDPLVPP